MEKVLWVKSCGKVIGANEDDGLGEVNGYLAQGWRVKHLSACATDNINVGQAYLVLEKNDD